MPLPIPARTSVTGSLQSYTRTNLPNLDPTVTTRRGWIGGMIKSLASAIHDWYVALKRYADYEPFPQTATGEFLFQGWWTDVTGLTRNPAAPARGKAVILGDAGTSVAAGTSFTGPRATYLVDSRQAVVAQTLKIASMTRSGSTVTVVVRADEHNLASGMTVTISGATQASYNGAQEITVTAPDGFTFELADGLEPATPATTSTSLEVSGTWGVVSLTCTTTGLDGNVDEGNSLTVTSPPTGLQSSALITFGGLAGGADIEDIEAFRARILEGLATDFGMFSAAEIKIVAKQVPGVTRVWVREAQLFDGVTALDVYEGQTKVAFVRDGDANIFPSSREVIAVRDHLVDAILPAHMAAEDFIVEAPKRKAVNFTFTALSPDTASMRLAILANLEQFFREGVDYGEDIDQDGYRCAIRDAWDAERRQSVRSFTLSSPTGTIDIDTDELPVLGTVTWPT